MVKSRFNIALLYTLVTVFLVIQWTPSHAHLNAQHDHGGDLHQHIAETHAHLPVFAHTESTDAGHNKENVASVVAFDHDTIPVTGNIQDNSKSVLTVVVGFTPLLQVGTTHFPKGSNTLPRPPPPPHIGEPRAPPRLS